MLLILKKILLAGIQYCVDQFFDPLHHARVVGGDFTEEAGNRAGRRLLRDGGVPTGFFAANDLSAVGLIDALDDAGFSVPDTASVVGYDNTAFAALNHAATSTSSSDVSM